MKKVIFSLIALMTAMVMNGQVKQTYLTLNNGVQMPQFGLGVYSIPDPNGGVCVVWATSRSFRLV
jgi:hypothetical protein